MKQASESFFTRGRALRLLAVLGVWALILVGCGKQDEAAAETAEAAEEQGLYKLGEPVQDSTIALIVQSDFGSDTLTTEVFNAQFQRFVQQMPMIAMDEVQSTRLRKGIAEEFIRRHLLSGEAKRLGLVADTAQVEGQLRMIRQQFPSEEAFQQALAAQNVTLDSLRSAITDEARLQTMAEKLAESAKEPTGQEVAAYQQEQSQQVRAQHILFRVPGEEGTTEEGIRQKAESVLDSVKAGTDFAALAGRHSDDGSAQQGGDLGFFGRGQMVPPFEKAAFSLADSGAVYPDLVRTSFGYHIIRLTGKRSVEPLDSLRAQAQLMMERRQDAFEQGVDQLVGKATVRLNPNVVKADLNAKDEEDAE